MFELDGGGFVSKYEIQNNPGKYPVYSSQTTNNGTMGNSVRLESCLN
ncbi:hypothetical protein NV229_01955 [Mesomycoplasma hyorhinis]|nr:hypothetical protein NV229_01955 [Mesomycoplasma hyorhinis]